MESDYRKYSDDKEDEHMKFYEGIPSYNKIKEEYDVKEKSLQHIEEAEKEQE